MRVRVFLSLLAPLVALAAPVAETEHTQVARQVDTPGHCMSNHIGCKPMPEDGKPTPTPEPDPRPKKDCFDVITCHLRPHPGSEDEEKKPEKVPDKPTKPGHCLPNHIGCKPAPKDSDKDDEPAAGSVHVELQKPQLKPKKHCFSVTDCLMNPDRASMDDDDEPEKEPEKPTKPGHCLPNHIGCKPAPKSDDGDKLAARSDPVHVELQKPKPKPKQRCYFICLPSWVDGMKDEEE